MVLMVTRESALNAIEEAAHQAYEDAIRICNEMDSGHADLYGWQCAEAIQARLKELIP